MEQFENHATRPLTTADSTKAADGTNTRSTNDGVAVLCAMDKASMKLIGKCRLPTVSVEVILGKEEAHEPQDSGGQVPEMPSPPLIEWVRESWFRALDTGDAKAFKAYEAKRTTRCAAAKPTVIDIREPRNKEWINTHPHPAYRSIFVYSIKERATGQLHPVSPEIVKVLQPEGKVKLQCVQMALTMSLGGDLFLWPVDVSPRSQRKSSVNAIEKASKHWSQLVSHSKNPYKLTFAKVSPFEDTLWPGMYISDVLEVAFGGPLISSLQDPLIAKLRGNVQV